MRIQKIAEYLKSKIVVFLGGECVDNNWRKEVKDQYSKHLHLIDPYKKDWESSDIYNEVYQMLTSDKVVFYNGGEGTKNEKRLLRRLDKDYKEFKNLDKLKNYLKTIMANSIEMKMIKTASGLSKHLRRRNLNLPTQSLNLLEQFNQKRKEYTHEIDLGN